MKMQIDLVPVLDYLDPATMDYNEWLEVGMALQYEGYNVSTWESWSERDTRRFHQGECRKKWKGFTRTSNPVTGATIIRMAKERGWHFVGDDRELDWNDVITIDDDSDDYVFIDSHYLETFEMTEPKEWSGADQVSQLIDYISVLFNEDEYVGFVTQSMLKTDNNGVAKYVPASSGYFDMTAGRILKELNKHPNDITCAITDYDEKAGVWIRFNPLDGKGVSNANVTDHRYALVESDSVEIEKQIAIIKQLELPVAMLVYSGGKSVHAIVHIDAGSSLEEYRKRVDYLYSVCEKNGLIVDSQNRNPSRLSRMPGVYRGDHKQFIIASNIGKKSWDEWHEWVEELNDDLPDTENLADAWDNLPDLAPCLIDGVLRQGHKMLIAGPSKAGKSFLQMELCIAIAEGTNWLRWQCAQGKVLYVNLELDRASCLHRLKEVYEAMGIEPAHRDNIDIWNLRGKSTPMDKLAPKLIRRAMKKNYIAVILDPIYKVITGDENSADQMARFCNQFDKICTELRCAVIYCHHHSKGAQGGKKAMDRASGSGVFARDPDALLDVIELEPTEVQKDREESLAVSAVCADHLDRLQKNGGIGDWRKGMTPEELTDQNRMVPYCQKVLSEQHVNEDELQSDIAKALERVHLQTAWRIDGVLREFPRFEPVDVWFKYPVHVLDRSGMLKNNKPEEEKTPYQKTVEANKKNAQEARVKKTSEFEIEFSNIEAEGQPISVRELAERMGAKEGTVREWLGDGKRGVTELKDRFEKYCGEDGTVYVRRRKSDSESVLHDV